MPIHRFRFLWSGLALAFLLGGPAFGLRAEVIEDLVGTWAMSDESTALTDPQNPADFRIASVSAAKNDWSDGSFAFAWAGDTAATRGYYSLQTGRVWLTTRRYLNGRWQQVEYRGGVNHGSDGVTWSGTAATTNATPTVSWSFVATRR